MALRNLNQRIRGFTTMRYINRLFTYLLTYFKLHARNEDDDNKLGIEAHAYAHYTLRLDNENQLSNLVEYRRCDNDDRRYKQSLQQSNWSLKHTQITLSATSTQSVCVTARPSVLSRCMLCVQSPIYEASLRFFPPKLTVNIS